MDLAGGYWQVDFSPSDREKWPLISSEGLYEPTQMPQDCVTLLRRSNAMENLLSDLNIFCVLVYHDDITVFFQTLTKHLSHLRAVFVRLRDEGLKLKPSKCLFFKDKMEFLGITVSN